MKITKAKATKVELIKKTELLKTSAIIFISMTIGFILYGENIKSTWNIIDDHEIMSFLGQDGKLPISEIPAQLMQTEVGKWGKVSRFRPSYYSLRLLESSLWGKNTALWFGIRILWFVFFIAVIGWLVYKKEGLSIAAVFILILTAEIYWTDIFSRLGPGETYAVVGLGCYLLGFYYYWQKIKHNEQLPSFWPAMLMASGAVVAIGSKENFILLLLSSLYLLFITIKNKKNDKWLYLATGVILAYTTFVCFVVAYILIIKKNGIHVHTTGTTGLMKSILKSAPFIVLEFKLWLVGIVSAVLAFAIFRTKNTEKIEKFKKTLFKYFYWVMLLIGLYLSQFVFYGGIWPTGIRYDFPGMLAILFFWLISIVYLMKIISLFYHNKKTLDVIKVLLLCSLFIATQPLKNYHKIIEINHAKVEYSQRFTKRIATITDEIGKNHTRPIVFESHHWSDYEPIASTRRFLLAYGIDNPMFLKLIGYSEKSVDAPSTQGLIRSLEKISVNGGQGDMWGFRPLAELAGNDNDWLLIEFSGKNETSPAKQIKIFP